MATLNHFMPRTGAVAEWNAAYYRLEDYLRAHHITNKLQQSQIILRLIERAARRHEENQDLSPVTLVMDEAFSEIDSWFKQVLANTSIPTQRLSAVGRVGLVMTDAIEKWPGQFLDVGSSNNEFRRAMIETSVRAGHDLEVSSMVPRPLDEPPAHEGGLAAWERLGGLTVAFMVFALFIISGGLIFYWNR